MSTNSQTTSLDLGSRALAGWEIVSVLVSCLLAEWIVLSFLGHRKWAVLIPALLALGLMLVSHVVREEGVRDLGFRLDNFWPAIRLVLLPTILLVGLIVLVVWLMTGDLKAFEFRPKFLVLFFWALFQQYVLQGFVNRRAQLALGRGWSSILLVGVFFGLVHLPNPVLSALTVVGGLVWAWVYQRYQNLFALALSHTVASFVLTFLIPAKVVQSLRVGFKFFG